MKMLKLDKEEHLKTMSGMLDAPVIKCVIFEEVCFYFDDEEKIEEETTKNIDALVEFHATEMNIEIEDEVPDYEVANGE